MDKLRRALRDMLVIGILLGLAFCVFGRNVSDAAGIASCLLAGLIFSPPVWAIYRLGRFILLPRASLERGR